MDETIRQALVLYLSAMPLAFTVYQGIAANSAAGRWPWWLYWVALFAWPVILVLVAAVCAVSGVSALVDRLTG